MSQDSLIDGEVLEELPPAHHLMVTAYAPLQIVQTANYVRFGPNGVRRFGPGSRLQLPHHPLSIAVKLTLKGSLRGILQRHENLLLHTPKLDTDGVNIWSGEQIPLKVTWVWDFYRLYSGVQLAMPEDNAALLQQLRPGDQLILEARSPAGDILQVYPIDSPAEKGQP